MPRNLLCVEGLVARHPPSRHQTRYTWRDGGLNMEKRPCQSHREAPNACWFAGLPWASLSTGRSGRLVKPHWQAGFRFPSPNLTGTHICSLTCPGGSIWRRCTRRLTCSHRSATEYSHARDSLLETNVIGRSANARALGTRYPEFRLL